MFFRYFCDYAIGSIVFSVAVGVPILIRQESKFLIIKNRFGIIIVCVGVGAIIGLLYINILLVNVHLIQSLKLRPLFLFSTHKS